MGQGKRVRRMIPFESVDAAIEYGEDIGAGELCCFLVWGGRRYTAHIDRRQDPLQISLHEKI